MAEIKLLALDLDGTLFTKDKQVTAENRAALKAAEAKGIHVVITTGRPLPAINHVLGDLGLLDDKHYSVTFNGGLVQRNNGDILMYFMPRREIKERTEELLEFCDLIKFRKRTVRKLSGGMKRKLMVCRALLTEPEILLLDEPTAGMDALSRRQMWNLLRKLNGKNLTILLTTHYMEEAQNLCSRVALMDHGKLEEINTPSGLIDSLGRYAGDVFSGEETRSSYFNSREEAIAYLSGLSGQASLRETTLEDVFVERAGRHLMPS